VATNPCGSTKIPSRWSSEVLRRNIQTMSIAELTRECELVAKAQEDAWLCLKNARRRESRCANNILPDFMLPWDCPHPEELRAMQGIHIHLQSWTNKCNAALARRELNRPIAPSVLEDPDFTVAEVDPNWTPQGREGLAWSERTPVERASLNITQPFGALGDVVTDTANKTKQAFKDANKFIDDRLENIVKTSETANTAIKVVGVLSIVGLGGGLIYTVMKGRK